MSTSENSYSEAEALNLLAQLERILDLDPLIDEVGFIHPSQLATLKEEIGNSLSSEDKDHESTSFWIRDHKLGISTQILIPVYKAAKHAFISALRQYKTPGNFSGKSQDDTVAIEVMIHSKALLLLSCDFATAWNSRKLIVSNKQLLPILMDELRLSAVVLSHSPKSEQAWSHRRWVINMISRNCSTLQWIIERESELVEKIAEVLNELKQSRNWSGLHVADNSCFHYHRRLMIWNLEGFCHIQDNNSSGYFVETYQVWKEELDWNESLIKRYVGREALWLHRRFLSLYLIKHIATHLLGVSCQSKPKASVDIDIDSLMDHELCLVHSCSTTIPDANFEDFQAQAIHSAAYMLWLTKQIPEYQGINIQEKLQAGAGDLMRMLKRSCPDRSSLWDYLVGYHSEP
ncbi:protein prenylyltransferase superfamily protein [Citrus sinensis]|uniref:Protein prenylyltransferase superfamily protein n=1 Tax=Citrus sinensis TaxID=2711 RepID=A0ACB8IPD7_CITSI|nr:protein prenylyltransferase superfamily protein [Citrus sinensis]